MLRGGLIILEYTFNDIILFLKFCQYSIYKAKLFMGLPSETDHSVQLHLSPICNPFKL